METTTEQAKPDGARKAGMVAVVGRANVGKSSLINTILGEKVSIVSPIAQTTRNMVRGILTEARGQIVFTDTPGVHKASNTLGKAMNQLARGSVEGVDAALLVLDDHGTARDEDRGWITRLARADMPVVLALNKSDLPRRAAGEDWMALWALAAAGNPERPPPLVMRVSAQTGEGLPALLDALFGLMPAGELLFPEDMLTDFPRMLAIADVIREKMYRDLREELPHAISVHVESVDEVENGGWHVQATIYVNKHSQKGIVLGEKGRGLRKVKRSSEGELSAIYDRPVRVTLWVKVEPKWADNFWMLKKLGHVP